MADKPKRQVLLSNFLTKDIAKQVNSTLDELQTEERRQADELKAQQQQQANFITNQPYRFDSENTPLLLATQQHSANMGPNFMPTNENETIVENLKRLKVPEETINNLTVKQGKSVISALTRDQEPYAYNEPVDRNMVFKSPDTNTEPSDEQVSKAIYDAMKPIESNNPLFQPVQPDKWDTNLPTFTFGNETLGNRYANAVLRGVSKSVVSGFGMWDPQSVAKILDKPITLIDNEITKQYNLPEQNNEGYLVPSTEANWQTNPIENALYNISQIVPDVLVGFGAVGKVVSKPLTELILNSKTLGQTLGYVEKAFGKKTASFIAEKLPSILSSSITFMTPTATTDITQMLAGEKNIGQTGLDLLREGVMGTVFALNPFNKALQKSMQSASEDVSKQLSKYYENNTLTKLSDMAKWGTEQEQKTAENLLNKKLASEEADEFTNLFAKYHRGEITQGQYQKAANNLALQKYQSGEIKINIPDNLKKEYTKNQLAAIVYDGLVPPLVSQMEVMAIEGKKFSPEEFAKSSLMNMLFRAMHFDKNLNRSIEKNYKNVKPTAQEYNLLTEGKSEEKPPEGPTTPTKSEGPTPVEPKPAGPTLDDLLKATDDMLTNKTKTPNIVKTEDGDAVIVPPEGTETKKPVVTDEMKKERDEAIEEIKRIMDLTAKQEEQTRQQEVTPKQVENKNIEPEPITPEGPKQISKPVENIPAVTQPEGTIITPKEEKIKSENIPPETIPISAEKGTKAIEKPNKEIWQMTREEYIKTNPENRVSNTEIPLGRILGDRHENSVVKAIQQGKSIPEVVLKDYPNLKKQVLPEQPTAPEGEIKELPKDLKGAKPRYNIGTQAFIPDFESDIDKSLFITSQKTKSKRDEDYRNYLRQQGFDDNEINENGQKIRQTVKSIATQSKGGTQSKPTEIHIAKQFTPKIKEPLLTKPEPNGQEEYIYHGTGEAAFRKIRKEGLKPKDDKGFIYFSETPEYSETYSERKGNPFGSRILRIKKTNDIIPDENIKQKGDYKTDKSISPDNIEVLDNGTWKPIQEYSDESINIMPIEPAQTNTANNNNDIESKKNELLTNIEESKKKIEGYKAYIDKPPELETTEPQSKPKKIVSLNTKEEKQQASKEIDDLLGNIGKKKEEPAKSKRINVVDIPIENINTNTKAFQNREDTYSEESVNSIIDAVNEGTFDFNKFDPIRIWKNPEDNKYYVLAGHSRLEAFKRLVKQGKADYKDIPAIIMANKTFEEAKKFATEESNNLSAPETLTARAKVYRNDRLKGVSDTDIRKKAKQLEKKNASTVLSLSYLNPDGKAINAYKLLDAQDAENKTKIGKIITIIGRARELYPDLTDSHENELYDYLFKNADKFKSATDFINTKLRFLLDDYDFDYADPLNIESKPTTPQEADYRKELRQYESDIKEAEQRLSEKREAMTMSKLAELEKLEKGTEEYRKKEADINKIIDTELEKIRSEILYLNEQKVKHEKSYQKYIDAANDQFKLFDKGEGYGENQPVITEQPNNLVAVHNLTKENLKFADKMGGLAMPSIAITKVEQGFNKYGDITLIGDKDLINPENTKVYNRDIYSPTYPTVYREVYGDKLDKKLLDIKKLLDPLILEQFDSTNELLDKLSRGDRDMRDVSENLMLKIYYLQETGQLPDLILRDKPLKRLPMFEGQYELAKELIKKYPKLANGEPYDLRPEELKKFFDDYLDRYAIEMTKGDKKDYDYYQKRIIPAFKNRFGYSTTSKDIEQLINPKKELDYYQFRDKVDDIIKGQKDKYQEFLGKEFQDVFGREYLKKGNKKVPHTIENAMDIMGSNIRGAEKTMVQGLGKSATISAKKFSSIEEMKKNADRIVEYDKFKEQEDAMHKKFFELSGKISSYYKYPDDFGFIKLDNLSKAIGEIAKFKKPSDDKINSILRKNGYINVSDYYFDEIREIASMMRDMPTEYFEAKKEYSVNLSNFKGALIPNNASQTVRDILNKHNIPYKEYNYSDDNDRLNKLQELSQEQNILFDKGDPYDTERIDNVVDNLSQVVTKLAQIGSVRIEDIAKELSDRGLNNLLPYLSEAYRKFKYDNDLSAKLKNEVSNENEIQIFEKQQTGLETTDESELNADTGAQLQPEPEHRGTNGNKSPKRIRPGLRYFDEESVPNPTKVYVDENKYNNQNGEPTIDEHQRFAANLAIDCFEKGNKSFLLADSMGVGKTRTEIAIAKFAVDNYKKPVLIVVPNNTSKDIVFKQEARAMRVGISQFDIGTYDDLRLGKIGKEDYGLVIYDEAHNLKNIDSLKTIASANVKADHILYATATPLDNPKASMYFLSEITNTPITEIARKLGINIIRDSRGNITELELDKRLTENDLINNLIKLRKQAITNGQMLRREYPFYGDIEQRIVRVNDKDFYSMQDEVFKYWNDKIKRVLNSFHSDKDKIAMAYGMSRQRELSAITEYQKLDAVFEDALKQLSEGRKVVIVAESINSTHLKSIDQDIPGFITEIGKKFKRAGIETAKFYGGNSDKKAGEIDKFQKDKVDVIITTPKSGGLSVSLDDQNTTGLGKQRVMYVVTGNYSGDNFQQVMYRISRRNTQSPSTVKVVWVDGSISDKRRRDIVSHKIRVARALQEGQDIDKLVKPEGITVKNYKPEDIISNAREESNLDDTLYLNDKAKVEMGSKGYGILQLDELKKYRALIEKKYLQTGEYIYKKELEAIAERYKDAERYLSNQKKNAIQPIEGQLDIYGNEYKKNELEKFNKEADKELQKGIKNGNIQQSELGLFSQAAGDLAEYELSLMPGREGQTGDNNVAGGTNIPSDRNITNQETIPEGDNGTDNGTLFNDIGTEGGRPTDVSGRLNLSGGLELTRFNKTNLETSLNKIKNGDVYFTGKEFKSIQDLAVQMQALRDPRFETFRIFYLDKQPDGSYIIKGHRIISNELPNVVILPKDDKDQIKNDLIAFGASHFIIMHNHPSGIPLPSDADIDTTNSIANSFDNCLGHIIINHGKFSVVRVNEGKSIVKDYDLKLKFDDPILKDSNLLGNLVRPSYLPYIAKYIQVNPNHIILIGTSGRYALSYITEMPSSIFKNGYADTVELLNKLAVETGSAHFFIAIPKDVEITADDLKTIQQLYKEDIFTDVQDSTGIVTPSETITLSEILEQKMIPLFETRYLGKSIQDYKTKSYIETPPILSDRYNTFMNEVADNIYKSTNNESEFSRAMIDYFGDNILDDIPKYYELAKQGQLKKDIAIAKYDKNNAVKDIIDIIFDRGKGYIEDIESGEPRFRKLGINDFWDKYLIVTKTITDPTRIKEEVTKLYNDITKNAGTYALNEDSEAITKAIENEIEQGREQGRDVSALEQNINNPKIREKVIEEYAKAQKTEINNWVNYLNGQKDYPESFKYAILKEVLTKNYDVATGRLIKRSNKTLRGITPLNQATLSVVFQKYRGDDNLLKVYSDELTNQIELENETLNKVKETKNGEWIKFKGKTSDPKGWKDNASKLAMFVNETPWCTKTLAKSQLEGGDFYVYATKDKNGKSFPRIAIRMSRNKIGEVRGIDKGQTIEPDMLDVANDFLKQDIPGGEEWIKSIEYNKKIKNVLDKIENKTFNENDVDDLFYVLKNDYSKEYENQYKVKLEKVYKNDIVLEGIAKKFNTTKDKIYTGKEDINKCIVAIENVSLKEATEFNFKYILRSIYLDNGNITNLKSLISVDWNADFRYSKDINLENIKSIGGDAIFRNCENVNLKNLKSVNLSAYFRYSKDINLKNLKSIGKDANFKGSINISLENLEYVGGDLDLQGSMVNDLGKLKYVSGYADFRYSKDINLENLKSIGGDADFRYSKDINLKNLKSIGGDTYFWNSVNIDLENLESIGGNAFFEGSNITDLGNLRVIDGLAVFGDRTDLEQEWKERQSKKNKQQILKDEGGDYGDNPSILKDEGRPYGENNYLLPQFSQDRFYENTKDKLEKIVMYEIMKNPDMSEGEIINNINKLFAQQRVPFKLTDDNYHELYDNARQMYRYKQQQALEAADKGLKERKFTGRVMKSEEVSDDIKAEIEKGFYEPISNKQTAMEANQLIDGLGEQETLTKLLSDSDDIPGRVKVAATAILIKRLSLQEKKLRDEGEVIKAQVLAERAGLLIDKISQSEGTEKGRTIQAFSMWSLLTPEGALLKATKMLKPETQTKQEEYNGKVNAVITKFGEMDKETIEKVIDELQKQISDLSKAVINNDNEKTLSQEEKELLYADYEAKINQVNNMAQIIAGNNELISKYQEEIKNLTAQLQQAQWIIKELKARADEVKDTDKVITLINRLNNLVTGSIQDIVNKINSSGGKISDEVKNDIDNLLKANNMMKEAATLLSRKIIYSLQKPKPQVPDPVRLMVKTLFQVAKEKGLVPEQEKPTRVKLIEVVGNAVKREGDYRDVWDMAKKVVNAHFKDDPEALKILDAYFDHYLDNPFSDREISSIVNTGLKELEVNLGEVVRQHYSIANEIEKTLTEKLLIEAGLTESTPQIDNFVKAVQDKFKQLSTEKKQKILESIFTPKERKEGKDLFQKIIELSNLGALSDDKYRELFKEKFKLSTLSPEESQKIMDLVNKAQLLPFGSIKQFEATEELMDYIEDLKGIKLKDIGWGYYYASMLSGLSTHLKNFMENTFLMVDFITNTINPLEIPGRIKALFIGLNSSRFETLLGLKGETPRHLIKGKYEVSNALERLNYKGGWLNPLSWARIPGRFLKSADIPFIYAAQEMAAYSVAYRMARAKKVNGKKLRGKELQREIERILNLDDARIKEYKLQAEKEGLTGIDLVRRVNQLIEDNRDQKIKEISERMGKFNTFNNKPYGVAGAIAEMIGKFQRNKTGVWSRFIVPFTNIVSNVFNMSLNYTPIGIFRGIYGKKFGIFTDSKGKKIPLSDYEAQDFFIRGVKGLVAMLVLGLLMTRKDKDGKPLLEITASGPADYKKRKQLMETGWRPNSVKIGARYIPYDYISPVLVPLTFLGVLNDRIRYGKMDKEANISFLSAMETGALLTISSVFDKSFMSGIADLLKAFDPNSDKTTERYITNFALKTTTTVVPNAIKQFKYLFDPQVYNANTFTERLLKNIGIATKEAGLKPELNLLGEPVKQDWNRIFVYSGSKVINDPIWSFIVRNGTWISTPDKETLIWDKNLKKDRQITPDEYYEYVKISGKEIRDNMTKYLPNLEALSQDDKRKVVTDIVKLARENAIYKLTGRDDRIKEYDFTEGKATDISAKITKNIKEHTEAKNNDLKKELEDRIKSGRLTDKQLEKAKDLLKNWDKNIKFQTELIEINNIIEKAGAKSENDEPLQYHPSDKEKENYTINWKRISGKFSKSDKYVSESATGKLSNVDSNIGALKRRMAKKEIDIKDARKQRDAILKAREGLLEYYKSKKK